MRNSIEVKNYTFTYPNANKYALNIEEFYLEDGGFSLLFGKSACGKTTFLRQISDNLMLKGKEEGVLKATKDIAYVWQNPESQIVTDRVEYEIAFGLENHGFSKYLMDRRIAEVSDFFGIENILNHKTMDLSGGQKQIVNLAAAVAIKPKLLLLDEPTSQLDPVSALNFFQLLKKINEDLGISILLVEQRLEEIITIVDKIAWMDGGRILFHNSPEIVIKELKDRDWKKVGKFFPTYIQIAREQNKSSIPIKKSQARKWLMKNFTSNSQEKIKIEEIEKENEISLTKIIARGKEKKSNLQVKDLFFRYDNSNVDIINDCNFVFPNQTSTCIVGPNGCGKSTFLRILYKYISNSKKRKKFFSGKILSPGFSQISFLPQECKDLFIEETIEKNLLLDKNTKERELAIEIAKKLNLKLEPDKSPLDLSGGEMQKLALAMVLSKDADIILLDEPTKGMDNYSKDSLGQILNNEIFKDKMKIIVSHDMEFAAKYMDYMTIMFNGSLKNLTEKKEFFLNNFFYNTNINMVAREIDMRIINLEDFKKYAKKID